jgi:hypothetical protein
VDIGGGCACCVGHSAAASAPASAVVVAAAIATTTVLCRCWDGETVVVPIVIEVLNLSMSILCVNPFCCGLKYLAIRNTNQTLLRCTIFKASEEFFFWQQHQQIITNCISHLSTIPSVISVTGSTLEDKYTAEENGCMDE